MNNLFKKVLIIATLLTINTANIYAQESITINNRRVGNFEKSTLKQWKREPQLPAMSTTTELSIKGAMSDADFKKISQLFPCVKSLDLSSVSLTGESGEKIVRNLPNTIEVLHLPAECDIFKVECQLEYNQNKENLYPNLKKLYCYSNTHISIANGAYVPFVHIKEHGQEDISLASIGYNINTFLQRPKLTVIGIGLLICSAQNRKRPKSLLMYDRDCKKRYLHSWSYAEMDKTPLSQINHIEITNIFYAIPKKADCPLVDRVVIPKNVESISQRVFANTKITEVEFESGSLMRSIPQELFRNSQLEKINIPASINQIDASAFIYCSNLKEIKMDGATPPTVVGGSLQGLENATIYIPKGSSENYSKSERWRELRLVEQQ